MLLVIFILCMFLGGEGGGGGGGGEILWKGRGGGERSHGSEGEKNGWIIYIRFWLVGQLGGNGIEA